MTACNSLDVIRIKSRAWTISDLIIDTWVPLLVESTDIFVSPFVLVASVIEMDEVLKGSVDPLISAIVVEDSENRAGRVESAEIDGTDSWKIYLVLYNSKKK